MNFDRQSFLVGSVAGIVLLLVSMSLIPRRKPSLLERIKAVFK